VRREVDNAYDIGEEEEEGLEDRGRGRWRPPPTPSSLFQEQPRLGNSGYPLRKKDSNMERVVVVNEEDDGEEGEIIESPRRRAMMTNNPRGQTYMDEGDDNGSSIGNTIADRGRQHHQYEHDSPQASAPMYSSTPATTVTRTTTRKSFRPSVYEKSATSDTAYGDDDGHQYPYSPPPTPPTTVASARGGASGGGGGGGRGFRHQGTTHTTYNIRNKDKGRQLFASAPSNSREAAVHEEIVSIMAVQDSDKTPARLDDNPRRARQRWIGN